MENELYDGYELDIFLEIMDEAFWYGDFDRALEGFMRVAKNGHTYAKYMAGLCCERKENFQEAFKWFEQAAQEGNIDAQIMLAKFYETGVGTTTQTNRARESYINVFKKCIKNIYDETFITKIDVVVEWGIRQAELGDNEVQYYLGLYYKNCEADMNKARIYLEKASKNGHIEASKLFDELCGENINYYNQYNDDDDLPF